MAPKPPCPILSAGEKLLVAVRISSMEKTELWNYVRCYLLLLWPPLLYSPRVDDFVPAYPGTAAVDRGQFIIIP